MPLKADQTIGIMGGGQLGRMLAMAAAHMGYRVHIFTPEEDSPASQVAADVMVASYSDAAALRAFAQGVDVITFEFENVPHESLELLASLAAVHPSPRVLETCRNRLREKEAINSCGIATAPFAAVRSLADLQAALTRIGTPAVLKTTELGYDGKGQVKIHTVDEAEAAWEALKTQEAVLEGWVTFEREISVIVARDAQGNLRCYDPAHNIHKNHILDRSVVPAGIAADVATQAEQIAQSIARKLELVGIMAVELFLQSDGTLIVNELAPRPHNSGHWTMEAAATSQFEQQIRAICGHALGDTRTLCPAEMVNLIGEDVLHLAPYYANPAAHVHLYGKTEARAGRKMGHVTILGD